MSALLMGRVWQLDGLERSERDILLALADHAHDDGTSARPGVPYLMWKCGLAKSTIHNALRGLEAKNLIEATARGGGRGRVTEYVLHLVNGTAKQPFDPARNGTTARVNGTTGPPETVRLGLARDDEPSLEPSEPSPPAEWPARRRDLVWDVLVDIYGPPTTRGGAARGRIVQDFKDLAAHAGVSEPEQVAAEVRRRHAALEAEWGSRAVARALVENWAVAGRLADRRGGHGDDMRGIDVL